MKGLYVRMKYKEMFENMRERDKKIFANVCLYKLTENTNAR